MKNFEDWAVEYFKEDFSCEETIRKKFLCIDNYELSIECKKCISNRFECDLLKVAKDAWVTALLVDEEGE